jgi:hypothetical protein
MAGTGPKQGLHQSACMADRQNLAAALINQANQPGRCVQQRTQVGGVLQQGEEQGSDPRVRQCRRP